MSAAALIAASVPSLRAQSFTFAELKSFSREYTGTGSRNPGTLTASLPQGFLQSEAFQALKAKIATTPLTEFPQSLQPKATSLSRDIPHPLAVNVVQPGSPTAVPELPEYAVVMGFATLAYVVIRRRGAFAAHPLTQ